MLTDSIEIDVSGVQIHHEPFDETDALNEYPFINGSYLLEQTFVEFIKSALEAPVLPLKLIKALIMLSMWKNIILLVPFLFLSNLKAVFLVCLLFILLKQVRYLHIFHLS